MRCCERREIALLETLARVGNPAAWGTSMFQLSLTGSFTTNPRSLTCRTIRRSHRSTRGIAGGSRQGLKALIKHPSQALRK